MKAMLIASAAILASLSTAANASGALSGRVGLNGGTYSTEYEFRDLGCCFGDVVEEDSDSLYGIALGGNLLLKVFYIDLGVELSKYNAASEITRSDGLLTLGFHIGNFQIFGGYRHSTFGDGFFSSEAPEDPEGDNESSPFAHSEYGPFLGVGLRFRIGESMSLATTAAYNLLTFARPDTEGGGGEELEDLDYDGVSVKVQLGLPKNSAVFVRWQRFSAEQRFEDSFSEELTDDYLIFGVQKGFTFASW
jgi:hypothetical protein